MVHPTSDYLKPITFLVIDNKTYMRRMLKNVLETLGAKRIEEARDGADGLAAVKGLEPDIVLTGWRMKPVSGLDFLKAIRGQQSPIRFTPVIMVTSETRREKVVEARNAGVTEYIAMPITAKAVFLRIREVIERPRPFVDIGVYFGPDRRRRAVVVETAEDERRGKGTPREEEALQDSGDALSQSEIDRLVAGGDISED
ncbi:MAG: response regulator [Rhodospirillaceae bacterium]|jgi:two-component system, chemotaxis family, chemotaxis protein CheY|nr:response regulator [Rhodospirillaceae bacterium]MBT5242256.1 response regulator [Rhodospirillaceae bacterium]MBT5565984.1 response regulator [Rhodospirillaceae bacterium]MBT6088596.1 response regulator [Rhodospirillaceae bacterium]MBT6960767.1 response regulator [Rhodospirillaceae bacterium]